MNGTGGAAGTAGTGGTDGTDGTDGTVGPAGTAGTDGTDATDGTERTDGRKSKARFASIFLTKTRDEWADIFYGTDACCVPVLNLEEAAVHPHNVARGFERRSHGSPQGPIGTIGNNMRNGQ